ncbi:MAG TPA: LysR family transcriptional regulator [Roseiarcus sp.]|nr:LysR family transcriptional regulator [Roseiarcus sp.]
MYKDKTNPHGETLLMRGIPIDILRAFVAVVEARGFTRAAEELGRTQPTISLQVKRLEELVEAPLFKKGGRFELSGIGEVCLDYGKRLLRLHDDMLDEIGRNNPDGALRIGMPSEFASILAPRLDKLRADAQVSATFEVIVDSSQTLSAAFRQNLLDVAFVVGSGDSEPHRIEQWRGQLRWFGQTFEGDQDDRPAPLLLPPPGSPFHEAATGALRVQGRKFEIVCICSNFAVLAAAAAAGLGVTPIIEGLAPEGLEACPDKSLPALPEVTLLLLARSQTLAFASRRWVASVVETLHRNEA